MTRCSPASPRSSATASSSPATGTRRVGKGPSATAAIGEAFFVRAERKDWFDCVWNKHQGELRTWFGGGDILQDDHVFCDNRLAASLGLPWVATQAAEDLGLSDHAPLVLDFDVRPVAMTSLGL